jgi:hypothetical protein
MIEDATFTFSAAGIWPFLSVEIANLSFFFANPSSPKKKWLLGFPQKAEISVFSVFFVDNGVPSFAYEKSMDLAPFFLHIIVGLFLSF